jgi:hypothetical protein
MLSFNLSKELKEGYTETEKTEKSDKLESCSNSFKKSSRKNRKDNCSLPPIRPIHHIKMDLNFNLMNETTASKFKKTNWNIFGKKKQ